MRRLVLVAVVLLVTPILVEPFTWEAASSSAAVHPSRPHAGQARRTAGRKTGPLSPMDLVLKPRDIRPTKITSMRGGRDRDDGRYEVEFKFAWGRIESSATVYRNATSAAAALRQQALGCRADPPATSLVRPEVQLGRETIACFVIRLEFGLYSIRWVDGNVLASVSVWEDRVYKYGLAAVLARKQAHRVDQALSAHR
jgi:hypothetical protein